jgi:hypothetical protein
MSGADTLANSLFSSLISGASFSLPVVDLTDPVFTMPTTTGDLYAGFSALGNADLTTQVINGTGTFDVLMSAVAAQLKGELSANRISGAEYTKAYITAVEAAIGGSIQFLLGRDRAHWMGINAQLQAQALQVQVVTARVQLEIEKARLETARMEAQTAASTYALTKLKLATESVAYDVANYQLGNILPQQLDQARAQTKDTNADGSAISGNLGKQKALYDQQITSYQRDSQNKAVKVFTDAWITMKTIDEGLSPPTKFANSNLDTILGHLQTDNGLT